MTQKLKKEKYLPFQTTHLPTKMNDFKMQHLIEVSLSALSKACALCSLWSGTEGCTAHQKAQIALQSRTKRAYGS